MRFLKTNKKNYLLAFIFVTVFFASIVVHGSNIVDGIAAIVGSDIILISEVYEQATPHFAEVEKAGANGSPVQNVNGKKTAIIKQTIEMMINDTLVVQQARAMKIVVTSEEINMAIANMARQNGIDAETFEKALATHGTSIVAYKAQMQKDLLKYKVLNLRVRGRVKVDENEARQYYNAQVRDVRISGFFTGAHILIRVPKNLRAAEVSKLRKKADDIKAKIDSGADFEKLAKEFSEDLTTAKFGGSLGKRDAGDIPKVLERAFLDLEPGETFGPLRTPAGFHVLKLNSREDLGVESFSTVKDKIIEQLMQEAMLRQQQIWINELRGKTFIDIRI